MSTNSLYTLLTQFNNNPSYAFWKRLGIILTDVNQKPKEQVIQENLDEGNSDCDNDEHTHEPAKLVQPAKILNIADLDAYGNAKICRKKGLVPQPSPPTTEDGVKPNMNVLYDKARYEALIDVVRQSLENNFTELDHNFVDKQKFFSTFDKLLKSPEFYNSVSKTFLSSPAKFLGIVGKMCKTLDDVLVKPLQNFVWYFNPEFLTNLQQYHHNHEDNYQVGKLYIYAFKKDEACDAQNTMMQFVRNRVHMLVFHSDTYSVWLVRADESTAFVHLVNKSSIITVKNLTEYMTSEQFKLDEFYTITVDDIYRMLFNKKYEEFRTASLSLYVTQPTFKCMMGKYKLDEELNEGNVDELRLENMSDGMISDYSSMDGFVKKVLMMANYYGTIGDVHLTTVWMVFYDLDKILPSVYYDQFDWTEISSSEFLEYAIDESVMFRKYLR